MSVRISITTNARLVAKNLETLNSQVLQISAGRIRGRMEGARRKLSRYPERYSGTPEHRWASERQRRYVMAAIREGTISVPYSRTGRYGDHWRVVKKDESRGRAGYSLTNDLDEARYIAGNSDGGEQYHLHAGRWPLARTVVEEEIAALPGEILDAIYLSGRRMGL